MLQFPGPLSTWPASSLCRWDLVQLQFFLFSLCSELLGLLSGLVPRTSRWSPVALLPCWWLLSTPSSPLLALSLLLLLRTRPSRTWSLGLSLSLRSRSLEKRHCPTTTLM